MLRRLLRPRAMVFFNGGVHFRCPFLIPVGLMKLRMYFYVAAYCAAIFWLSSQSHPPHSDLRFIGSDKLAHFVLYGGLAALVSLGLRANPKGVSPRVQWLVPIIFAALYGVTDEIHQLFVPERSFDPWDMVANSLGAVGVQLLLCGGIWRVRILGVGAVEGEPLSPDDT
jgi:VanZ family protein